MKDYRGCPGSFKKTFDPKNKEEIWENVTEHDDDICLPDHLKKLKRKFKSEFYEKAVYPGQIFWPLFEFLRTRFDNLLPKGWK